MGIEAPSPSISDTGASEQYNMRNYKSNRDLVLALSAWGSTLAENRTVCIKVWPNEIAGLFNNVLFIHFQHHTSCIIVLRLAMFCPSEAATKRSEGTEVMSKRLANAVAKAWAFQKYP
jgi:hypothetical protein